MIADFNIVMYAAGLFDGEGCVETNIQRGAGEGRLSLALTITMCDPRPLVMIHDHWGGNLSVRPSRRKQWRSSVRWVITGQDSCAFAAGILPYSITKHDELETFLALQKLIQNRSPIRSKIGRAEVVERARLVERIRSLKKVEWVVPG